MRLTELLIPREGLVTISNIWFGDRMGKMDSYKLPDGSTTRAVSDYDYDLNEFNRSIYYPESFSLALEDSFLKYCNLILLYELPEDDNEEEDLDESNHHYDWLAVIKLNAYFEHVPHDTAWEIREFVNNLKKSGYFHVTITEERFSTIYFCTNAIHSLRIEISDTSVEVELRYQDQETLIDDNALFKTLAFIVH